MYAAYDFVVMSSLLQPLVLSTIQVAWASLQKTIDTRVFSFSTLCLLFYPVYFYYTDKHSPHEVKIRKYASALGHRNQSRPDIVTNTQNEKTCLHWKYGVLGITSLQVSNNITYLKVAHSIFGGRLTLTCSLSSSCSSPSRD
jgi:hypothetical protein